MAQEYRSKNADTVGDGSSMKFLSTWLRNAKSASDVSTAINKSSMKFLSTWLRNELPLPALRVAQPSSMKFLSTWLRNFYKRLRGEE